MRVLHVVRTEGLAEWLGRFSNDARPNDLIFVDFLDCIDTEEINDEDFQPSFDAIENGFIDVLVPEAVADNHEFGVWSAEVFDKDLLVSC